MITKFDNFINEGVRDLMTPRPKEEVREAVDNLPIHQRFNYIKKNNLEDIYTEIELEEFKKEYDIVLYDVIERYNDKIGGLAEDFIKSYSTEEDYNNELAETSGYYDTDEEDPDEYEPTGEDEVWVLHQMGIELGHEIGGKSDYGICNVLSDDWCDFFNELSEIGW